MFFKMDTPKSFSIDALLSKEASPKLHRAKSSAIAALQGALSPVQGPFPIVSSSVSSGGGATITGSRSPPHLPPGLPGPPQPGHGGAIVPVHRMHPTSSIIPKPGLLNLPPHGPADAAAAAAAVVPALYAHPLYASYLNGHHPHHPSLPHQLSAFHAASEHMLMKGASHGLPGVPIEWIRGGMMLPRFGDYPVAHGQLGECVYAFGGQTPIGKLTNELWKGEVSDNHVKWTILQTTGDTPSPRLYATLCELTADKLILVGGSYYPHITTSLYWDMKMCSADVYIFEVTTCQWSKVTCDSPQLVRMHHCAIPIEDNVCIAGGAFLTESGILQPNQDIVEIWQEDGKVGFHTVGKLSLWSMGHLLLNEQIYFIGGYTSEKVLSENIHIMDPGTYTVSKGGDGPKGLVKACKFPKKNSGLLLVESSGKADIMVLNGQEENEGDIQEMDNQEQEEEEENEGEEDGEESDDEDDEDEQEESDAEDEQEEEDEDDDQSGEPIRPTDFACDPCKIREGREGIYEPIQDFALIEIGKEAFATCQKCKRNFHLYCQGERRVPKNLNELYFYCKNSCRTKRTGFTNQLQ